MLIMDVHHGTETVSARVPPSLGERVEDGEKILAGIEACSYDLENDGWDPRGGKDCCSGSCEYWHEGVGTVRS